VDLPPPVYREVEGFRALKRPGTDRFEVEALDEEIEKRLQLLMPFLRSPPRDARDLETRFPSIGELFAGSARALRLVPPGERSIHSGPGVEAFVGDAPPAAPLSEAEGWLRGPLEIGMEVGRLVSPLTLLEAVSLKVVGIEGPPETPDSEILYQLAGQGADGRRHQWNGRWRIRWAAGWTIGEIRPLEATRVVLS